MYAFIVSIFVIGYVFITFEHVLKIDKLIPALIMMAVSWAAISFNMGEFEMWFNSTKSELISLSTSNSIAKKELLHSTLLHHFGKTCEILIFLMGAMAIVEMIDHFDGFSAIKKLIKTRKKVTLLWILCALSFFLSAIIDNLTATIVLITLLRKIISNPTERKWFSGLILIAANAGGAWTPIGDVTTTMLWMAGKVSSLKLGYLLFVPSFLCGFIPVAIASFLPIFKGEITTIPNNETNNKYANTMLICGLTLIIAVPIFKTITHLPPYIGMMFSLSVFAIIAELLSNRMIKLTYGGQSNEIHTTGPTLKALSKIEMPSILFFLGILMTVAALESLGLIYQFGGAVNASIPQSLFVLLLGVGSAIIDNVPLVAATIGMFKEPLDANIWHHIAYSAGTGGSLLIIGSAAGIVAMGMEKITFSWYLKNISWLALIGFLSGLGTLFIFA